MRSSPAPALAVAILLLSALNASLSWGVTARAGANHTHALSFPGPDEVELVAGGRYGLLALDADDDSTAKRLGDSHALFLVDIEKVRLRKVLSFGRHATALWSPRATRCAITNYEGSNLTSCLVYDLAANELLPVHARTNSTEVRLKAGMPLVHSYEEAVAWCGEDSLVVHFRGYGSGGVADSGRVTVPVRIEPSNER